MGDVYSSWTDDERISRCDDSKEFSRTSHEKIHLRDSPVPRGTRGGGRRKNLPWSREAFVGESDPSWWTASRKRQKPPTARCRNRERVAVCGDLVPWEEKTYLPLFKSGRSLLQEQQGQGELYQQRSSKLVINDISSRCRYLSVPSYQHTAKWRPTYQPGSHPPLCLSGEVCSSYSKRFS